MGLKGIAVLAFTLGSVWAASAQADGQHYVAMGEDIGDFNPHDVTSIKSENGLLHTAVGNLLSLGYVKHAVMTAGNTMLKPEYVLKATTLYKNPLGYNEFYIQLDLREKGVQTPDYSFHFVYQDSSTQGNHGPNRPRPDWMVLKSSQVESTWKAMIYKLETPDETGTRAFQPIGQFGYMDPFRLAMKMSPTFKRFWPELDGATISWITWKDVRNNVKYAAVSYMTKNIPYVTASRSISVVFKYGSTGEVEMADGVWLASEFLKPLEAIVTGEEASIPYDRWAQEALDRAHNMVEFAVSSGH
jgi:hypothetical protein